MARRNALVLVAASILPLAPTVNASAHELTVRVQNVQPARSGNIVIEIWRRDEFEVKISRIRRSSTGAHRWREGRGTVQMASAILHPLPDRCAGDLCRR